MKYAVIRLSGRQFKVSEGETIQINLNADSKPEVLLYADDKKVLVGNPLLNDVTVGLSHTGDSRGKKILITRFKAKSRYDKTRGYVPKFSDYLVNKIVLAGEAEEPKKLEKPMKAEKKNVMAVKSSKE